MFAYLAPVIKIEVEDCRGVSASAVDWWEEQPTTIEATA
jgi:hypothetical protein